MNRKPVIAIDGPAASGKSTTARLVSKKLGYLYIDTGAMYRAITFKALRLNISPKDAETLTQLANQTEITLREIDGQLHTFLDGLDVSKEIRLPEVTLHVSDVSSVSGVRRRLVALQQEMGKNGGVVLEGRDIGTVVFPDAEIKVFMQASIRARAERRQKDLAAAGHDVDLTEIEQDIERRDRIDSTRTDSPLKKADDAIVLDTTNLTIEEQVAFILSLHDS